MYTPQCPIVARGGGGGAPDGVFPGVPPAVCSVPPPLVGP